MNRDQFESQWTQIRHVIKDKWGNLTEEDVRQINGRYDQLINKLQQRYGYTRDVAEEELRNWNVERARAYATDKTYGTREDETWRTKKADDSSLLKWLLAAGIPLLLLAGYLAHESTKAHEDTYGTRTDTYGTRTRMISDNTYASDNPEDRSLAQNVRRALIQSDRLTPELANNLRIEITNGVITVRGTVPSARERDVIIRILEDTQGVKQVNNQIQTQR